MPLLPLLMCNDFLEPRGPSRRLERLLHVDDNYPVPFAVQRPSSISPRRRDNSSVITSDKNTFQVSLDVQQFAAEELTVKSLNDNIIQVEGKHEERQDEHGFISRHFIRKYVLPKGHDTKNVTSTLSSDGILTLVSRKRKRDDEREIPIKLTGPSNSKSCESANKEENPENKDEKENDEPKEKKTKMN